MKKGVLRCVLQGGNRGRMAHATVRYLGPEKGQYCVRDFRRMGTENGEHTAEVNR